LSRQTLPTKIRPQVDDPESNNLSESTKASIRSRVSSFSDSFSNSGEESPLLHNQPPRGYGASESESDENTSSETLPVSDAQAAQELPFKDLLTQPLVIALANHGFLSFLDQAHQALLPLMYSTSVELGGLSLRPDQIGIIMGAWGACNAVFQVTCFPKLMAKLGPKRLYVRCFTALLVTFSAFPILNTLARWYGNTHALIWITICCQMSFYTFVFMGYGKLSTYPSPFLDQRTFAQGCTQLFIMDAAPGRNSLGAVNSLGQMMSSVTRTIAPSFASSLFSISLQKQWLGGYFVYFLLLIIVLIGSYVSHRLPRGMRDRS